MNAIVEEAASETTPSPIRRKLTAPLHRRRLQGAATDVSGQRGAPCHRPHAAAAAFG